MYSENILKIQSHYIYISCPLMLRWLDSQAGFLQMLTDITPGLSSYKIVTSAERELLPPPPLNIPETKF